MLPLSLYIHIPWCVRKCPYCDFNSHPLKHAIPEKMYIQQLINDLDNDLHFVFGRQLKTIFLGGGTPSLLSPEAIHSLLEAISLRIPFEKTTAEITLEANPGTVDQANFMGFREAGINRLSIGIQSFNDKQLQRLGRVHDRKAAIKAVETAHQAGFKNINVDLMFGLPEQTTLNAMDDLKLAIDLNPTHLSWYQLTLEPNTLFYRHPPLLPQEEFIDEMFFSGQELLAESGLKQYEVSAYAKEEHQCQHNLNYWEFGDYVGIGAGAHGKLTDKSLTKITRTAKLKHPKDYLAAKTTFLAEEKTIPVADIPFEFMLNALRLYRPIPLALFESRTGLSLQAIDAPLTIAREKGFMQINGQTITTTELGKRFLNNVINLFM